METSDSFIALMDMTVYIRQCFFVLTPLIPSPCNGEGKLSEAQQG
jgi:hypothetical protein